MVKQDISPGRLSDEELFESLMQQRADRRGLSREEIQQEIDKSEGFEQSDLWRSAEQKAAAAGVSVDDLLQQDAERVWNTGYPGPNCLEPHHVQLYVQQNTLPEPYRTHLQECDGCRSMLAGAIPDPQRRAAFLNRLGMVEAMTLSASH